MSWIKRLFWRRRLYNDLSDEIREHLEEKIAELEAEGMSKREARAAARREFGDVSLVEEGGRACWGWTFTEGFFADVPFTLCMVHKPPRFARVPILTLCLAHSA